MKISKKVLREYISSIINEARVTAVGYDPKDGQAAQLKTGQVKFSYGTYKGRLKDMPYYVAMDIDQKLGDIQRRGDPYTYVASSAGKMKVVSGPAKDVAAANRFIGAVIANPDVKPAKAPEVEEKPPVAIQAPQPKRYQEKTYNVTKEQVAALGMEISKHSGVARVYKSMAATNAKKVASGELSKDKTFREFMKEKVTGLGPEATKALMKKVGINI